MATITLTGNTNYSALTVENNDTIDLAGYILNLNVNPAQTGVQVITPGTAGQVLLGSPTVFTLAGWTLTAGTGQLITSVVGGKTLGGNIHGGSVSGAYGVYVNLGTLSGSVKGGSVSGADGCYVNEGLISGNIIGGNVAGSHGLNINRSTITGTITGGGAAGAFGVLNNSGPLLGAAITAVEVAISLVRSNVLLINGPLWVSVVPSAVTTLYSLFGRINPLATVSGGTTVITLSGDIAAAMTRGNVIKQRATIKPSVAPRLWFSALDNNGLPITDLLVAGITSAAYVTITAGVRSSSSSITLGSKVADTAAHSTGQLVTIKANEGWYAIDAPAGAALSTADYAELVVVLVDGTRLVHPTLHPIDVAVSTRNAVTPPTVAELNARTLPSADYFNAAADTVARVTLVDTTTANTDMRGTDGANTTTPPTAASIATAVWGSASRTLTAISDSSGITTLLTRITGLLQTKTQADTDQTALLAAIDGAGEGGGLFPVTVLTPEQASGHRGKVITIVQGDDYTGIRELPIELATEANLVDQYMLIAISRSGTRGFSFRGKVYAADDKQFFKISLTKAQSSAFVVGPWDYIIRLETAIDQESQISHGTWQVNGFTTPAPILGTPRT